MLKGINRKIVDVALALLLCAGISSADTIISTFNSVDSSIGSFGTPDTTGTPTYGQTFVVPTPESELTTIAFSIQNPSLSPLPFRLYLYLWDGLEVTGNAQFTSSVLQIAPSGSNFQTVTIPNLSVVLNGGDTEIAFLSTIGLTGPVTGLRFQTAPDGTYSGGMFEYNNATSASGWTAGYDWNANGNFGDLGFSATFVHASPEPGSMALLAIGTAIGAALLRRRARKALQSSAN